MKRKMIFKTILLSTLSMSFLVGCKGAVEETPDGYVDTLPSETKDGTILHAFCWKYSDVESQLPYIANAGYKSVQISPVQVPKSSGSSWWAFYQPLAFRIADNGESPLGTKAELKQMCNKAEEYGISIIADIVFNHMANISDDEKEADGTPKVSPLVEAYEPEIYADRNASLNPTFHHNPNATGSGSETQVYPYGGLPDLNTANALVQEKSLALLKECIDVGIDGFRFDAAKHIETPDDPDYPSDFWPNTLEVAKEYYKTKTGHELYAYGETLGSPYLRPVSVYTKYMDVTDGSYGDQVENSVSARDGARAIRAKYGMDTSASNLMTWLESHDDYVTDSHPWSNAFLARAWAVLNTRKEAKGIYLARPDNMTPSVGIIGDYFFREECIGAVNRFKNRFIGAEELQGSDGAVYFNERYTDSDKGAVVVDFQGRDKITVKFEKLGTGVYYDQITGKAVTVRNGKATIELDSSAVSVLTMSKNKARPTFDIDNRGGLFAGNKAVTVTYKNATEATYQINDRSPVAFTSGSPISFSTSDTVDDIVTLKISIKNEQFSVEETFKYQAISLIPGKYNIVNVNPNYFTNNEIYMWSWKANESGKWSQDYTVQDNTILVDVDSLGIAGMVFGLFEKDHVITNVNVWDDAVIRQTTDITGVVLQQGYYDGSNF